MQLLNSSHDYRTTSHDPLFPKTHCVSEGKMIVLKVGHACRHCRQSSSSAERCAAPSTPVGDRSRYVSDGKVLSTLDRADNSLYWMPDSAKWSVCRRARRTLMPSSAGKYPATLRRSTGRADMPERSR